MQTVYVTTSNFIRHTGNVVDLTQYRRRLAGADSASVRPFCPPENAEAPLSSLRRARAAGGRRVCPGMLSDLCASAAIVVMTAVAVVQFLLQ